MKDLVTIIEDDITYIALPVPKGSVEHKLNVYDLFEAYISYQSRADSICFTPYRVEIEAEIIGLASLASEHLKQMLIRNNIMLKDWVKQLPPTANTYEELLILQIPQQ